MLLPPLPADEWDDRTRDSLRRLLPRDRRNPEGAGPAMSTLARHPDLAEAFLGFSVYLTYQSSLPPRVRELAILRVAHRRNCAYEWAHHVKFAENAGIASDDVDGARTGQAASMSDQAVLRAVDELDGGTGLSGETWARLGEFLDERQRMDLIFTVGGYATLAIAFNTFGVRPEH